MSDAERSGASDGGRPGKLQKSQIAKNLTGHLMTKHGLGFIKVWRQRRFVLEPGKLSCYRGHTKKPRGVVRLTVSVQITVIEKSHLSGYEFHVAEAPGSKKLMLGAKSLRVRDEWLAALRQASGLEEPGPALAAILQMQEEEEAAEDTKRRTSRSRVRRGRRSKSQGGRSYTPSRAGSAILGFFGSSAAPPEPPLTEVAEIEPTEGDPLPPPQDTKRNSPQLHGRAQSEITFNASRSRPQPPAQPAAQPLTTQPPPPIATQAATQPTPAAQPTDNATAEPTAPPPLQSGGQRQSSLMLIKAKQDKGGGKKKKKMDDDSDSSGDDMAPCEFLSVRGKRSGSRNFVTLGGALPEPEAESSGPSGWAMRRQKLRAQLPKWIQLHDSTTGHPYYVNQLTRDVQWNKPDDFDG